MRFLGVFLSAAWLLVPSVASAADAGSISTVVSLGAVAIAVAASCWAVAAHSAAGKLRHALRAASAQARAATAARDAIIEAGRESVLVWGREREATWSYAESRGLLDSCLLGSEAVQLSQALDDLSESGAKFTLEVHDPAGELVQIRGRPVGALAAIWLSKNAPGDIRGTDIRDTLDALPFPVWLRDSSLALNWGNRAYAATIGAPEAIAALGKKGPLEKAESELATVTPSEGNLKSANWEGIVAGQRRAFALTEAPLRNGSILGVALDTGKASPPDATLQEHVVAHADTLNQLATAIAIFGKDQLLSFYNRAFLRLWELPENWLNSHPSDGEVLDHLRELQLLPEQRDFQAWKGQRLVAYERQSAFIPEEQWHLPGGRTLRVVTQPHPLGGVIYLYEDITEKLALESSYNTLIGVQRATLDSLGEAVAVFGLDGRLKLHNAAFLRLWRLEPDDLVGDPHVQRIAEVCLTRFGDCPIWRTLLDRVASGEDRRHDWGQFERSDHVVLSAAVAPLPDGATLVTFADVTDRSRAEAALQERNEALLAADELKSEFVQHASFLFRNPLNAVLGFADLLASGHAGALTAKQGDYVQNILAASQKLAEITSDILDLAMIESGDLRLELAQVDLFQLLSRAVEPFRQHASGRDVTFSFDVAPDIGPAMLDERRIRQAVFNLLSNAARYTPRGGNIALGAQILGEDVQIYVSDSGPGIAPEVQAKVFARFEAMRRGGQRAGAGLGLALVNSFVALHDGWVEIETAEHCGTLVRCHLPRRVSEEPHPQSETIHAA